MWSNMLPIMVKFGKVKKKLLFNNIPNFMYSLWTRLGQRKRVTCSKKFGYGSYDFFVVVVVFVFFLLFLYNGTIKQNLVKFKYIHIFN